MLGLIAVGALVFAIHLWSRVREVEDQERRQRELLEDLVARLRGLEAGSPAAEAMRTGGARREGDPAARHATTAPATTGSPPDRSGPAEP